jgi:hypothetical protein
MVLSYLRVRVHEYEGTALRTRRETAVAVGDEQVDT